uniref:glucuronosyltransferase n=1 Tax=Meloidogyne javanica TaxID=6303 RepID=A0A915LZ95_MELJA
MAPRIGLESSFFLRFLNFYNEFLDWLWIDETYFRTQDKIIREEFGQDFPNLKELVKDTSLMFINSNPFLELTRPTSNKIIYIGGLVDDMASEESKKLDEAINFYEAKEGAVLFSFGSLTDTTKLNERMLKSIMGAFRRFPKIHFIWKVDNSTVNNNLKMFESATNVHNFEWFRQPAILVGLFWIMGADNISGSPTFRQRTFRQWNFQHPNTRAFITHCGQNSLTESARAGVPIIGIPLFGDQFYNCIVGETRGLGVQVDISHLKESNGENVLVEALEKILYQPKYQQNAKIISKKLKLTPFSPTERLVKWVEFAAEFGDLPELNLPGEKEMNWFVYYSLDVILFSIIVLAILFWVAFKCFKWILLSIINSWFTKIREEEKKKK